MSRDERDPGLRPPPPSSSLPGAGAAVPGCRDPPGSGSARPGSDAPLAQPGPLLAAGEKPVFQRLGSAGLRPPLSSSRSWVFASRAGSYQGPELSSITRETRKALVCAGGVALPSTAVCSLPVRRTQPMLGFGQFQPLLQGGNGCSWVWMKGST